MSGWRFLFLFCFVFLHNYVVRSQLVTSRAGDADRYDGVIDSYCSLLINKQHNGIKVELSQRCRKNETKRKVLTKNKI